MSIGPVDILITNAGVNTPARQTPLDMDFARSSHALKINTIAPLAIAQAVLPQIRNSAAPRIVTVSSQMAWLIALAWWDWSPDTLRMALEDFRALNAEAFLETYVGRNGSWRGQA